PEYPQHRAAGTHLRQQSGARLDKSCSFFTAAEIVLEQWQCHEIAGQRDEVGFHSIDNVDRFANRNYRKTFVIMEIAHLRDPDSIPGFGQSRERNFDLHQLRIARSKSAFMKRATAGGSPYTRAAAGNPAHAALTFRALFRSIS